MPNRRLRVAGSTPPYPPLCKGGKVIVPFAWGAKVAGAALPAFLYPSPGLCLSPYPPCSYVLPCMESSPVESGLASRIAAAIWFSGTGRDLTT